MWWGGHTDVVVVPVSTLGKKSKQTPIRLGYGDHMTFRLAFVALPAGHSQQRARCARTGRFVRWALAPSLRVCGVPSQAVEAPAPTAEGGVSPVVSDLRSDSPACEALVSVPVRRRGTGLVGRALVALRSAGRRAVAVVAGSARSLARVAGGRVARFAGVAALALALTGDAGPVVEVPAPAQVAAARFDRGGWAMD